MKTFMSKWDIRSSSKTMFVGMALLKIWNFVTSPVDNMLAVLLRSNIAILYLRKLKKNKMQKTNAILMQTQYFKLNYLMIQTHIVTTLTKLSEVIIFQQMMNMFISIPEQNVTISSIPPPCLQELRRMLSMQPKFVPSDLTLMEEISLFLNSQDLMESSNVLNQKQMVS